jgi:sodium/proline symporter
LYELIPGFVAAWIAILVFSKIGAKNSKDVEVVFYEVQERLKE